ncbi:MAG: RsbRD N-terminal domain-containing protein [Bacillota bacterium]|nr:RsbRD N-terminal domain-containing protein [Bacillota bacterium]
MELSIYELLDKKKQQILSKWQLIAFSYENNDLLTERKKGSRFSNPIAYIIKENTSTIFEWLIKDGDNVDLFTSLKEICRLKAIQENNKPSEALNFIFALKRIIRESLENENQTNYWAVELWDVDQRIDVIGLLAFDIYSACEAQIYELRMNEIKRIYGRDA